MTNIQIFTLSAIPFKCCQLCKLIGLSIPHLLYGEDEVLAHDGPDPGSDPCDVLQGR
jgi:hypothetical protein